MSTPAVSSSVIIAETFTENFHAVIRRDPISGRVWFMGDLDSDADGANGQNGQPAAYMVNDQGREFLANGGMRMHGSQVVGFASWWKDIVYSGEDGQPLVLPNGVIPSKTAYQFPPLSLAGNPVEQWKRQADAAAFAYVTLPPEIVNGVPEIVKGCLCRVTWHSRQVWAFCGDVGPRRKVGEGSMKLLELLGANGNPRTGGIEAQEVLFEVWPGKFGTLNDGGTLRENAVPLLSSKGEYHLAA